MGISELHPHFVVMLVEHYFKTLKGFVRNKERLEISMAKGYAPKEALGFCT
jgi:hypothetical protein